MISKILLLCFLILLISCNTEPKAKFAKKQPIATCQENQGMVTYEVFLYDDATFYLPSNTLVGFSSGNYKWMQNEIQFNTTSGTKNLCKSYWLDTSNNILQPLHNCGKEFLYYSKNK
jgi:hypothetical protein